MDCRRLKSRHEAKGHQDNTEAGEGQAQLLIVPQQEFPIEEARISLVHLFSIIRCLFIITFVCCKWFIHYAPRVHIAAPIITKFVAGWTAVSVITTYLIDLFFDRSAKASVSLSLARWVFAVGDTSFVMPMVSSVRAGLEFTICAIVQGLALSGMAVTWTFGPT